MNNTRSVWQRLWEAGKEPVRIFIIGLSSWTVTYLLDQIPGLSEYLGWSINQISCSIGICLVVSQTQVVAMLILLLKTLDKYLHNLGKERGANSSLILGITRF